MYIMGHLQGYTVHPKEIVPNPPQLTMRKVIKKSTRDLFILLVEFQINHRHIFHSKKAHTLRSSTYSVKGGSPHLKTINFYFIIVGGPTP